MNVPKDALALDCAAESERVARWLRDWTARTARKRGLVVAVSGGVDSAVCLALAVRALGSEKVLALAMPERDSSSESATRARELARQLGARLETIDITPALDALGTYRWLDEAVRSVVPEYGDGWRMKVAIAGGQEGELNRFHIVARSPDGRLVEQRLPLHAYLRIVAATSYKQRVRKTLEYGHADLHNYAVVGTPNRLEYDQGFFVRNGDGAADVKPIAHLYKTQVYAMARYLGLPGSICNAAPTTDTYSLPQSQEEFFFGLPYPEIDLALWHAERDAPPEQLARALGVEVQRARWIYADIAAKRRAARLLNAAPATLLEPIA